MTHSQTPLPTLYNPLPTTTRGPLTPSSHAETALMTYLDNQLLEISRQHIISSLRHPIAPALEKLVDILWLSATPSLQKPYLLAIASTFDMDYIAAYPLDGSTFALLDKLDRCFYTLSEELTATEKVRVQSLVLATRLKVIRLVEGGASGIKRRPVACNHTPCAGITEDDEQNETDEDKDEDGSSIQHTSEEESEEDLELRFEISQVYHRTLQEFGEDLVSATS